MVLRRQKQVAVCEFKAKLVYIIPQLPGGHGEALCKQTDKQTNILNLLSLWLVLRILADVSGPFSVWDFS